MAFLGSDAKKQLFGNRPAMGETIRIGDFPYTVVGIMQHKEQDSSYDGRDISKVFMPFSAPSCATSRTSRRRSPDSVDRLLVTPRSHRPTTRPARARCGGRSGRLHQFDPHDKEAADIWDTVEEAKAFRADDGRHEVLPGRGGHRHPVRRAASA